MKSPSSFAPRGPGLFGQPPAAQAQARFQQALAHHQNGQLAQALQLYEQVIALQPKHFDALHFAGVILLQSGQAQQAVSLMDRAVKIDRNHAAIHNNRGAAYAELKEYDFALSNYSRAIALDGAFANAYNNRGCALIKLNRHAEAIADFDKAIAIQAAYFEAFNNRGNALSELRRYTEARSSFEHAVELNPQSADAHWNLGMCALRLGDFEPGWLHSEWRLSRWRELGWKDEYAGTRWTGAEAIEGRTILIHSEQGLGDTIQFCRYAPMVAKLGARVILEVQPALVPLLNGLPDVTVVARGSTLPAYDLYCPLLTVPMILKTDLSNMPQPHMPAPADEERRARWATLLGERKKPRVGIAWSGNVNHVDDYKRSLSLDTFAQVLCDEVAWISLHKDVREADQAVLKRLPQIADFSQQQGDFMDAVAMCEQLDLVITIDSSLAHLAASMGKPVWLLLCHNADWRWLTAQSESPWYDSMTLYRQDAPGDWAGLLQPVKADLRARFG